ncbi:MAG: serine hydrolase domain-containing protein [Brachymonas sp.]
MKSKLPWLPYALEYLDNWMSFQIERYKQPGCSVAICKDGQLIAERAYGMANIYTGDKLTPKHHFRIASHSKTFTAAGIMLLREQGKLNLDSPIGKYIKGLDKQLAKVRISHILSHGAGITRDGADNGQFRDAHPFLDAKAVMKELAQPQPLQAGLQLKYSNHGYALLGLLIEQITGESYADWMMQHVLKPTGLKHIAPDMPLLSSKAPFPSGHSAEFPFGKRLIIPGNQPANAIAAAGGFVATAADTARFFAQLAPNAKNSILSCESRREMLHRRWRDPINLQDFHYGLGTMMSGQAASEWFGHTGSLQGFISRTSHFLQSGYTISVLTNASDGFAFPWVDGILSILQTFEKHGSPTEKSASWRGRWWNIFAVTDLVPIGDHVFAVSPVQWKPFDGVETVLQLSGKGIRKDQALIATSSAFFSPGERVRRVRNSKGEVKEIWFAGSQMTSRSAMVEETTQRYPT